MAIDDYGIWAFALLIGGVVLWQFVTGKVLDRHWRPSIDRRGQPVHYWAVVLGQSAIFLVVVITGRASFTITFDEAHDWLRERRVREAQELHREKKWPAAKSAFDALAREIPHDARTFYGRGVANRNLGDLDAALADFRQVIALDPAHYPSYVEVDRILSARKRWDELLAMWGDYLARFPDKAEAWYERAGTNHHKGDPAAAMADATRACELGLAAACRRIERPAAGP
jgi:tetratricopeptide (TPR) repeat protein